MTAATRSGSATAAASHPAAWTPVAANVARMVGTPVARHDCRPERPSPPRHGRRAVLVGANESNINRRFAVPTLGGGHGAGQQLPEISL
jgi:hypothetical protein